MSRSFFPLCLWLAQVGSLHALSLLTYNVGGNGTTDWSTNAPQVQAIAREFFKPEQIAVTVVGPLNGFRLKRDFVAC